jgi:hypothetical protein
MLITGPCWHQDAASMKKDKDSKIPLAGGGVFYCLYFVFISEATIPVEVVDWLVPAWP